MNKPVKVDTSEFDDFVKKLNAANKDVDQFLELCAKELAIVLLRRTMDQTPRDTSNLVRRWTDHKTSEDNKPRNVSPEAWAEEADIERSGKEYQITISNPTEYAPYVEYGHRTRNGRGWVGGQFMLTMSVAQVENMKNGLLESYLADYLKGLFS